MIEIPGASRETVERNYKRRPKGWDGALRCQVCHAPIVSEKNAYWVHVHLGGGWIVSEAEADALLAEDPQRGDDLGAQPIGSDCLRQHPELRPYAIKGSYFR